MTPLDHGVIALYAAAVLVLGLAAARGRGRRDDLLLAGRRLPTWAVLISLLATELSAATFVGVPHASYLGDWAYLQFALGALAAKAVLAARVIPLYHRLRVVTVYGFLGGRYGDRTRRAAAACFLGGRLLASGARLFIASLAFAVVSGWTLPAAIVASGTLAGAYTLAGGLRAVVWTDVLQGTVLLVAALGALGVVAGAVGGVDAWVAGAVETGRTRVIHLEPWIALGSSQPLGVAVLGGFFLTLATHATDHDMVQRLLATRDGRAGARALLGSALLNFPVTALFLALGTGLAVQHAAVPPAYPLEDASRIVPLFALHELPAGLRGLFFAGLFAAAMSSLDSAVCAMAATWSVDVRRPLEDEPAMRRRVRWASAGFTAALVGAALLMAAVHARLAAGGGETPSLVEFALSAMTVLYGGLLGIFAVGILGRGRGSDRSARRGLLAGAGVGLLLFAHGAVLGRTVVAWPWWIPLSAALAAAVTLLGPRGGCSAAPRLRESRDPAPESAD